MNKQTISQLLNSVITDLRQDMDKKDINASGDASRSLRPVATANKGEIWGNHYIEQIVFGRGPTKGRGPGDLLEAIRKWIHTKAGFSGLSFEEREGLIYPITRNIHKEGTKRGNDPRFPGLDLKEITEKRTREFRQGIVQNVRFDILSQTKRAWGKTI